ncbi:MerR family transcriptional regulator [Thiocystis violacea]|uniref:MerR family transcriptional regulator n=1 Tax=Thiocystis violacea TaxID=13725 RepID=UPI001F5B23FA|nr:MerR family transcriptional regulator [Thiocystis violacea]
MTDPDPPDSGQTFRIGTVSRLTGVPTDTLRVWERRYHVVTPMRSEAGTRHYAAEDVGRLSLIKRLVDGGDAISSVANLSLHDLRERMRGADQPERFSAAQRDCRLVVCGAYLADRLRLEPSVQRGIELLGCFDSLAGVMAASFAQPPDVLVLELPTFHADDVSQIHQLLTRCGAERVLLIYGFASRSALALLDAARVVVRRAPLGVDEIQHLCRSLVPQLQVPVEPNTRGLFDANEPPPPRRFAEAELARLASLPASGDCDWQRHLIDLIASLTAFERYSLECASRSGEDVAAVAFINACTARARALMEGALERVVYVDADVVSLDAGDAGE